MADRFVTGDTVTLSNTFKVAGVATDPTTTTLITTEPGGTATTYTAGVLTHSSTGAFSIDLVTTTTGVWSFKWTGTGAAADVADGTFTVWPVTDSIDVLTLSEAKQALGLASTDTNLDDYLRTLVTAVSAQLDEMCGPVRNRTVTGELHDGGTSRVCLRKRPVYSITTVTEYNNTSATVLTAESNTTKSATDYIHDGTFTRLSSGVVVRRNSNTDDLFPSGRRNVVVTYIAGRSATTEGVPAKFKQAASLMLRNVWIAEQASGTETFGDFTNEPLNPILGPGRLNKVVALLENEIVDGIGTL